MEKSKKIKWIISLFALFLVCACIGICLSSANNNKNVYAASWSGDYSTSTESSTTVYTSKSLYEGDTANILSYSTTKSMSSFNTFTFSFKPNAQWNGDETANVALNLENDSNKFTILFLHHYCAVRTKYNDTVISEANYLPNVVGWASPTQWYSVKIVIAKNYVQIHVNNAHVLTSYDTQGFDFNSSVTPKLSSWGCAPSFKGMGFSTTNTSTSDWTSSTIKETKIGNDTKFTIPNQNSHFLTFTGTSGNNIVSFAANIKNILGGGNICLEIERPAGTTIAIFQFNTEYSAGYVCSHYNGNQAVRIPGSTADNVDKDNSPWNPGSFVNFEFDFSTTTMKNTVKGQQLASGKNDNLSNLAEATIKITCYGITGEIKNITFNSSTTPKCAHTWENKVNASYLKYSATCSKAAQYYKSCSKCGQKDTAYFSHGSATGHSLTKTAAVAATCTTTGAKEYHTCSKCGIRFTKGSGYNNTSDVIVILSDYITINKNPSNHTGSSTNGGTAGVHTKYSCCGVTISSTHSYTKTTQTAATCTTKGTSKYTCNCGYSYTSQDIAALGHNYSNSWSSDATNHWHKCTRCSATKDTANHSYTVDSGVQYSAATCTAKRKNYKKCSCGYNPQNASYVVEIGSVNSSNHMGSSVNGGTSGVHTKYSCCGATISNSHTYNVDSGVQYSAATCTAKRKNYLKCSCGYNPQNASYVVETGSVNSSNHTGSSVNGGTSGVHTKYSCCGATISSSHTYNVDSGVQYSAATCTAKRKNYKSCSCGYNPESSSYLVEVGSVDSSNHTGSSTNGGTANVHTKYSCCGATISTVHSYTKTTQTPATCTTKGTSKYACGCGYSYTSQDIAVLEHTWKNTKDYNETNHWIQCSICQEKKDLSNHVYDNNCDSSCNGCNYTRSITHNYVGEYEYNNNEHWQNCDVCGDNGNIEAHIFGEWVIISRPTQSTTGTERRTCSTCGYYQEQELTASNSASLTLNGDIGVNLYIDVLKYTEDLDAYVELTYNHNSLGYTPAISTDRISVRDLTQESDKTYKFSVNYASGQINDKVFLSLYNSNGQKLYSLEDYYQNGYSIKDYCDSIINDESQPLELRNLCRSIINYGMRAIDYFDYDASLENSTSSYIETIEGAPTEITSVPEVSITEGARYLTISRFSLVALSEVSIRVYFDTSGFIFDASYTVECSRDYKTGYNDYGYYVEVYGIESVKIDELFTITIYFNGDQQNKTIIEYSALNYIAEKYEDVNSSKELKDLCLAINQYNYCAKAYFKYGSPWEAF